MYILPTASIKLFTGVPFDANYQNTTLFDSAAAQQSYFNSLTGVGFTDYTYQRADRDYIQVFGAADNFYNVNYMRFQNSPTSKIFYCFVDDVQFINPNCARLHYQIDILQTYMFDYELLPCYVEREHSETDEIGDNLVEEKISIGELEYLYVGSFPARTITLSADYTIVTATTFAYSYSGTPPTVIIDNTATPPITDGLPQGLFYKSIGDFTEGNDVLKALVDEATTAGKDDGIVAVFGCPTALFHPPGVDYSPSVTYTVPEHSKLPYTPKNNKLYTWPYTRLIVTDLCGVEGEFRYELFNNSTAFYGTMPLQPNPVFILMPASYNNPNPVGALIESPQYALKSTALPIISYTTNAFREWLAQNRFSLLINGLSSSISLASIGAPPTAASVVGLGGNVISTLSEAVRAMQLPPQLHNTAAVNSLAPAGYYGYQVFCQRVNAQYEHIIDDYFTVYGYATNRVKIPNRNSRPHWNYVKTNFCDVSGDISAQVRSGIEEIYNRGVTFWKNPSEIGNYSLDNSPT